MGRKQMSNEWIRNWAREYRKRPYVKAARALDGKRRRAVPKTTWDYIRMAARTVVRRAIENGDLVRQPCETCGLGDTAAHHDDYTKPMDVRWVCRIHHAALPHRQPPHPDYECSRDGCSCHWYWYTRALDDALSANWKDVACPSCGQPAGSKCRKPSGGIWRPYHRYRRERARNEQRKVQTN